MRYVLAIPIVILSILIIMTLHQEMSVECLTSNVNGATIQYCSKKVECIRSSDKDGTLKICHLKDDK
jgi:hypothetical protein